MGARQKKKKELINIGIERRMNETKNQSYNIHAMWYPSLMRIFAPKQQKKKNKIETAKCLCTNNQQSFLSCGIDVGSKYGFRFE